MSYRCATCGGNHRKPETAKRCADQASVVRGFHERAKQPWNGVNPNNKLGIDVLGDKRSSRERSYDHWATSPDRDAETVTNPNWGANSYGEPPNVPNGHYFIDTDYWTPSGIHVWFRKFDTGRWANVWFVTAFEEDGKPELMSRQSDREFVFAKVCSVGPMLCMIQYGRKFSRCGVCNEELTEDEREEIGGHEECFTAVFNKTQLINT